MDGDITNGVKQIGIFGGSFNPVHCGHIALARHLLTSLELDEIWFVVSPLNPFKADANDLLADEERYQLTTMALADEPGLKASDCEMHLPRPSYMWNTLSHLSERYPNARFTLLIGADNWLAFDRWANSQRIIDNYRIAVYPRPGYTIDATTMPPSVTAVQAPLYPISSTEIRQRVAHGLSIEDMVPPSILPLVERYYGNHTDDSGRCPGQGNFGLASRF